MPTKTIDHATVSKNGGKTTRKRHGNKLFSLIARVKHAKTPQEAAKLKKEIAALVAKNKAASLKKK